MKKKITTILALCMFLTILGVKGEPIHPNWFDEVQFLNFEMGYSWDPRNVLGQVEFTGNGWGEVVCENLNVSELAYEVNQWHSRGRIYCTNATLATEKVDFSANPAPDSHRLIDLYGEYFRPEPYRVYSIFSPEWRSYMMANIEMSINAGADGITIDEGNHYGIMDPFEPYACVFDQITEAAFRAYLDSLYTDSELLSQFDISDISTFTYRDWIFAHGMEETWNQKPYTGLAKEMYRLLQAGVKDFADLLVTHAHEYAQTNYGREFVVSFNMAFEAGNYGLVEVADFMTHECFPMDIANRPMHPDIKKMAGIREYPIVAFPELVGLTHIPQNTVNLAKVIVSDIYASGGIFEFKDGFMVEFGNYENEVLVDFAILNQYSNFITSNASIYEDFSLESRLALINSHASQDGDGLEREWTANWISNPYFEFKGIGMMLGDLNVQYDVPFAPDRNLCSLPSFTLEQLQQYDVVVLPSTYALDDEQASIILDYIDQGGTAIAIGSVGTHNPDGTVASRPDLLSLQTGNGVHAYGDGLFVFDTLGLGNNYIWDLVGISRDSLTSRLSNLIMPYMTPLVKTNGVSQVHHSGGATAFLYKDQQGTYAVHLVNYDYDEYTDDLAVKQNFELCLQADTNLSWEAIHISPDFSGQQVLSTYNDDSGYVCMIVPELEAYSIIILQVNDSPPELLSQSPDEEVIIADGDSKELSVTAQDPDGNPLYYQWYVNDVLDPTNLDSAYVFETDPDYSGIDTVRVEISDGNFTISAQWIITTLLFPYMPPSILSIETHEPAISPDSAGALRILIRNEGEFYDPAHHELYYCGVLADMLEDDFLIENDTISGVEQSDLDDADILFYPMCNVDITTAERDDIRQFVQDGGRMVILGGAGWHIANEASSGNIYYLLDDFGFHTDLDPISSLDDTLWYPQVFELTLSGTHPATSQFVMETSGILRLNWCHKLDVVGGSAQIIETTGDLQVWEDENWDGIQDAGEPLQSDLGIIGVNEYGAGKVVYIPITNFTDSWSWTVNSDLIVSVMKWLADGLNPNFITSSSSHDYGQVQTGTDATWNLEIFNRGTSAVEISGIAVDNPDYSVDPSYLLVPKGENGTITVTYSPPSLGSSSANLTATTDDPITTTIDISLSGEGFFFDEDSDGIWDGADNCPTVPNTEQTDTDTDGVGDACDRCPGYDDAIDPDNDSIPSGCDNCVDTYNPNQTDTDGNEVGDACQEGYTPVGSDVLVDASTSVSIQYDNVTSDGLSLVSTSSSGPPPPDGYELVPADPAIYYDITTTAVYDGQMEICIQYEETAVTGEESDLRLMHYTSDPAEWNDITILPVDVDNNRVCGTATTLSPFILTIPIAYICGDANGDGTVNIADASFIVNAIFFGGAQPDPEKAADANDDGSMNIADASYLVNWIFFGGDPPCGG